MGNIAELAAMLPDGRHVCPKCNGGGDGEHSLSVRRDEAGRVHYRCFRSSCGTAGGPRGVRSVFAGPKREPRYFTRPIQPLDTKQYILIETKFGPGIADEVGGYSPIDDRFILPVHSTRPIQSYRGCLAYSLSGAKPKSLTYNEKPDEPFLHHAGTSITCGQVLVEDWFSAEKVATTGIARGVCINGTYLEQSMISELVETAEGRPTWVALDRDAYTKTLLYLSRFREQFPGGLWAWFLAKDLKYETTDRIREALVDGKVGFTSDARQPERV